MEFIQTVFGSGVFVAGVIFVLLAGNTYHTEHFALLLGLGIVLGLLGVHIGGW